jgi:hypothetical protein
LDPCSGTDVASCPADHQHEIDGVRDPNAAEPYLGRTEDIVTFFYASQGALRDEVVRANSTVQPTIFAPTNIDPSRPIEFWFVVRDDRGGMSFTKRTAALR